MKKALKYYIGASIEERVRNNSSSGGIFTVLARYTFGRKGVVFAACFDKNEYLVRHRLLLNESDLYKARKSKYVWSDFLCVESQLHSYIEKGVFVMFIGTPCQATYIKKKYGQNENLLVVDLFCHGTAEPQYFKEYLGTFGHKVNHVDFRSQSQNDESNFNFLIEEGGVTHKYLYDDNIFTLAYIESVIIRKSCFECKLSREAHSSDITLGDFGWNEKAKERGINVEHPSIIAINTELGYSVFETMKEQLHISDMVSDEEIAHYYRPHNYIGTWGYNLKQKKSFDDNYSKLGFVKAAYKSIFPVEYQLIDNMSKKIDISNGEYYLYGNGYMAKKLQKVISDIFPNVQFKGYIVTSKKEDASELVMSIDEYMEKNIKSLVVVGVTAKYINEVCNELNKRGIENYIYDMNIGV